jgi:hypothetical protein
MKLALAIAILTILFPYAATAQRGNYQLGLRVGEPMGISFKAFTGQSSAFEFVVATAAKEWSSRYYRSSFSSYDEFSNRSYRSHAVGDVLYGQARYLRHSPIVWEGVPGTVEWYWGFGVLGKMARVEYFFHDNGFPAVSRSASITDYDIGPESMIGIEYSLEKIPLSMFIEVTVFLELIDRTGIFRGFTNVGIRYNF